MPDEPRIIIDDLPSDPSTQEFRDRMTEWLGRVMREEAERIERGLEAQMGIIAASSHHTEGRALDSGGDEVTYAQIRDAIAELRRQQIPEIPEWQARIIQAMIEGRTIVVHQARSHGMGQLLRYLQEVGLADVDARVVSNQWSSPSSALIVDPDTPGIVSGTELVNIDEANHQLAEARRARWDELYANTPPESPFIRLADRVLQMERERIEDRVWPEQWEGPTDSDAALQDWLMASWFTLHEQVPDEITDAARERWANELETRPYQGDDSGGTLSSDELLEAIGEAVDEWKDVRDDT